MIRRFPNQRINTHCRELHSHPTPTEQHNTQHMQYSKMSDFDICWSGKLHESSNSLFSIFFPFSTGKRPQVV